MTSKRSTYRYMLIVLIGMLASILLVLAWPRMFASLRYLPVDTAISKYWESQVVDSAQLEGLIARAEESIALHDHYRYWDGLSELHILNAQDMDKPFWKRRQELEQSISAAEEVVRRAPAKPRTWLRIARTKAFLAYPAEQVVAALKMSVLTGRVEPTLMLARLELGLRYLSSLDQEAIGLLRDQAVLSWTIHQHAMIKYIKAGAIDLDLLREVLSVNNPSIIAEMESHFVN